MAGPVPRRVARRVIALAITTLFAGAGILASATIAASILPQRRRIARILQHASSQGLHHG